MKSRFSVAAAISVSFVAGMFVAAARPNPTYHEAAAALQGEIAAMQLIGGNDPQRGEKSLSRAHHWLKVMEVNFNP